MDSIKQPTNLFTLTEIFENRFFVIPDYQRGYSWEDLQVNDLIKDIENLISKNYVHFTGTIVASPLKDDNIHFDIVDGQQRLTSLIILLVELWRQNKDNPDFDFIWSKFIERGDTGNKELVLRSNDETRVYFQSCIIKNEDLQPEIKSHECIKEAKAIIREWLTEKKAIHLDVLNAVLTKMGFIFFTPQNDKEIGIMFEVINNRGKKLTELEKIKNYFIYYSTVHGFSSLRENINSSWKDLQKYLNQAKIHTNEDENSFIRNCLIIVFDPRKEASKYAYDNLKIRFNINETDEKRKAEAVNQMNNFIDFIKDAARNMAFLNNRNYFETSYNGNFKTELGNVLSHLRCMPSTASILPLYLALMTRWNEEKNKERVVKLLELIEVLNFRVYVLPGISTRADSGQGSTFWFSNDFYHYKDWNSTNEPVDPWFTSSWETEIVGDVFDWLTVELREFIFDRCNDRQMLKVLTIDNLEDKNFFNWKQGLRYFLANYEESLWKEVKKGWGTDVMLLSRDELSGERQNDYLSIEHIWASNNHSEEYPYDEMQKRRLGNFVLLGIGFNSSLKDIDIPDKIEAMQDSNSQNKGAITLFQVAELQEYVKESELYLAKQDDFDRNSVTYFHKLATRLCDIRETDLICFAFRRWANPVIPPDFTFKEIDSFVTSNQDTHYIIEEHTIKTEITNNTL